MKKHVFLLITILTFSFILTSCGTSKENVKTETPIENEVAEVVDIEEEREARSYRRKST